MNLVTVFLVCMLSLRSLSAVIFTAKEKNGSISPPVIDIAPLVNPKNYTDTDRSIVRAEILQASQLWGFFHVTNHGISTELQQELIAQMKLFFHSPQEVKYAVKRTEGNSRGFADDELTKRLKDVKEIFDVGQVPYADLTPEALANQELDGYNQWPVVSANMSADGVSGERGDFDGIATDAAAVITTTAHLRRFRPAVEAYYSACLALSRTLVESALAAVIPCGNATYFVSAFDKHSSFLRLNYYPVLLDGIDAGEHAEEVVEEEEEEEEEKESSSSDESISHSQRNEPNTNSNNNEENDNSSPPPRRLGVSRHTDAGALTVLLQDLNPDITAGLEVRSGCWEGDRA